jgi:hypothetical protein
MADQAVSGGDGGAYPDALSDASNVLLLTPPDPGTAGRCIRHLTPPATESALGVTYTQSPTDWLVRWRTESDVDQGAVVAVGEVGGTDTPQLPDGWWGERVTAPADLSGTGIALTNALADLESVGPTAVCFDSVTALLQYADVQSVFRFLHAVTGRVSSTDAVAHYHLDPAAHDEQTVATVRTLFDAVAEADAAGDLTVTTR